MRIGIFSAWMGSLVLNTLLLLLGPTIRGDGSIIASQASEVVLTVIGLHFPALSVFAAFWFPAEERLRAKRVPIDKERAIAAYAITGVYLIVLLLLLIWPTYMVDYDTPGMELPTGASFAEHISNAVEVALLLSPIALAPVVYMTAAGRNAQTPSKGK